jgi:hypothetical protein
LPCLNLAQKVRPLHKNYPPEGGLCAKPVQGDEGPAIGYIENHPRPDDGQPCAGVVLLKSAKQPSTTRNTPRWRLVDGTPEAPLTLEPSIKCRTCGNHGHVRDGKWVPA